MTTPSTFFKISSFHKSATLRIQILQCKGKRAISHVAMVRCTQSLARVDVSPGAVQTSPTFSRSSEPCIEKCQPRAFHPTLLNYQQRPNEVTDSALEFICFKTEIQLFGSYTSLHDDHGAHAFRWWQQEQCPFANNAYNHCTQPLVCSRQTVTLWVILFLIWLRKLTIIAVDKIKAIHVYDFDNTRKLLELSLCQLTNADRFQSSTPPFRIRKYGMDLRLASSRLKKSLRLEAGGTMFASSQLQVKELPPKKSADGLVGGTNRSCS